MLDRGYIPKTGDIIDAYHYKPLRGGYLRAIKAQCQQCSAANLIRQDGLGASGVIEIWQDIHWDGQETNVAE